MTGQLVDVGRWGRWLEGRRGAARWEQWSTDHPTLRGWTTPDVVSPVGSGRTDAMQAALVALAQDGEGEAAQLLLVQMRPGLTRLCRWSVASGMWPWDESTDEVRAAFFETLYRHRLDRRPHKIAANLILDTRQRITRSNRPPGHPGGNGWSDRGRAPRSTGQETGRPAGLMVEPTAGDGDPGARLVATAAIVAAVGRLPGSAPSRRLTATVAYRAWILDQPRSTIAAELGLEAGTVNTRLHRLRAMVDRRDLLC